MEDEEFHNKVNDMFESRLKKNIIRIKNIEKDKILTEEDMNYSKVVFDSNLNIYKIVEGELILIEDDNFKAFIL